MDAEILLCGLSLPAVSTPCFCEYNPVDDSCRGTAQPAKLTGTGQGRLAKLQRSGFAPDTHGEVEPGTDKAGRCAAGPVCRSLLVAILLLFISPVNASCDGCIAPYVSEWRYRAVDCAFSIPPGGYLYDEESVVGQIEDALDNCPSYTGFDESAWVDLSFPEYIDVHNACGLGSHEAPQYSWHMEDYNKRNIVSECGGYSMHRYRDIGCLGNTSRYYDGSTYYLLCKAQDNILSMEKNLGPDFCPRVGNPVNIAISNKVQVETDLEPSPLSGLGITRIYNSRDNNSYRKYHIGVGWHSGHDRSLTHVFQGGSIPTETVFLNRPDASIIYFSRTTGKWTTEADTPGSFTETAGGWQYVNGRDEIEDYDTSGRLVRITAPGGLTTDYTYYPSNFLESVTTSLGESLFFTYDTNANHRIDTISDHTGRVWKYRYDASDNLEYVIYPDGTPLDDADNPVRRYHYENSDLPHALTGITDERGIRYASFEYDSNGRVTASYHGSRTSVLTERIDGITVSYDGKKRTLTNSKGIPSTYTAGVVVGNGVIIDIEGPGCASCGTGNTSYNYDPVTADLRARTVNGVTTEYGDYDASGNYGYRIEAVGTTGERRMDYAYDTRFFSKIATVTEPSVYAGAGKVTTYGYDDFGNRTSETISGFTPNGTPLSRTTTWQYSGPLHQLSQIDGPRNDVSDITKFRYYPDDPVEGTNRARLKEIEDATGTLVRSNIQYTATGKVASENRPDGLSLAFSYYPGNDRLEVLTESDGVISKVTRWSYLPTGEIESITMADGTVDATILRFGYDEARRLTRITNGLGNYIEYNLDTEGNREAENIYDSNGTLRKSLAQTFDLYNRVNITSQANENVDYDFAPDGTLVRQTDGEGTVTDYSYDALKRLISTTKDTIGLGAMTGYAYDVADNVTSVTDPANGNTVYQYDDLGNLLEITSPDAGTTVFTYDAAGNLKSRLDALGRLFIFSYDALNRLTGVDAPGTDDDLIYGYDNCLNGAGRLCSVIPPGTNLTFSYDAFGNVTEHQGLTYSHDTANRVRTITYPSGVMVTYSYDAAGQVSQVDLTAGGITTTLADDFVYAPFGALESLAYGNGATLKQSRDSAYRLTSQSIPGVLELGYTAYDSNGNLKTRSGPDTVVASFVYDALNRLDTASGVFGSRDYDYDLNGNRITLASNGSLTSYDYTPNSNRLSSETGWSYTLDANGNTIRRLKQDGSGAGRSFSYNSHNRLIGVTDHVLTNTGKGRKQTVTLQDIPVATYTYNGLGQRIGKQTDSSGLVQFRYGVDGALMAELDAAGSVIREYVYLNAQPLAVLVQDTAQDNGADDVILDNGMAPTGWVAKKGNKAFGENYLYSEGNSGNAVRWTTVMEAGQYQMYARWIANRNYSSAVPYTITHEGETDTVAVDQTGNGGTWNLLGSFRFDGAGSEYIEVEDTGGRTTADAIRLVRQGGTPAGGAPSVYFVHNDHLGTPQAMTDALGNAVWRAGYDPFGRADVDATNTVVMNLRFPGQYYDEETGLHYNYFRYYDPSLGRYISSDPIGLMGGLNSYSYIKNNPARYVDSRGLDNVGCDAVPDSWETPCRLECCAVHDKCYDVNNCSSSSWWPFAGSKACNQCNSQVKKGFIACGDSRYDDPERPNFYCATQHRFVKIPGDFPDRQSAEIMCGSD